MTVASRAATKTTKTIKESAKTGTITLTRDGYGTFELSDGSKTIVINDGVETLQRVWDFLEATV
jgi:hypothetical protein